MTIHKELLAFRDKDGEMRFVDSAPVSAVELVKDQQSLRTMLADAVDISAAGPVFAVVIGGKRV